MPRSQTRSQQHSAESEVQFDLDLILLIHEKDIQRILGCILLEVVVSEQAEAPIEFEPSHSRHTEKAQMAADHVVLLFRPKAH